MLNEFLFNVALLLLRGREKILWVGGRSRTKAMKESSNNNEEKSNSFETYGISEGTGSGSYWWIKRPLEHWELVALVVLSVKQIAQNYTYIKTLTQTHVSITITIGFGAVSVGILDHVIWLNPLQR